MSKKNRLIQLSDQELDKIRGGADLSELTTWIVTNVARYWTRKAYDPAYQEADYMIYKH